MTLDIPHRHPSGNRRFLDRMLGNLEESRENAAIAAPLDWPGAALVGASMAAISALAAALLIRVAVSIEEESSSAT
nr:hypothetical protein [uncultured Halomonas sp.]